MHRKKPAGLASFFAKFAAGFNDLSHFIRTFHNIVGISPGKYLSDASAHGVNYYFGPETEMKNSSSSSVFR